MKRIRYEEMAYTRNPNPARGEQVLSLDELRHYARKFWTDPVYSISNLVGGKSAFLRACNLSSGHFAKLFIDDPPGMQFIKQSTQRHVSKQVLNVLRGVIHYETDPQNINHALGIYDPAGTPPQGAPVMVREIRWNLHYSRFGPRIARVPTAR